MRHGCHGLHAARRDTPPDDRQQAHVTFILSKHVNLGALRALVELLVKQRRKLSWKLGHRFRLFLHGMDAPVLAWRAVSRAPRHRPRHMTSVPDVARPTTCASEYSPQSR